MSGVGATDPGRDTRLGNIEWVNNWTVGPGLRMEIMDQLGQVWLCHEPVTSEQARSLALPEGMSLALLGHAVADVAYFSRSPSATDDGPLDTLEVDGLNFSLVAQPVASEQVAEVRVMTIDKHHTLLYVQGRSIDVLDLGDGTFASPAWKPPRPAVDRSEPALPDGWQLRSVELTSDLIVEIPNPAMVAILADGSGFHGPLSISEFDDLFQRNL